MANAWRQSNQRASQTRDETGSIGGTSRCDVALLVEGKLFPQKEVFRCQHRSWTQTEAQETDDIDQQRQQRASEMQPMMEQARISCHCQGVPLQQGCNP